MIATAWPHIALDDSGRPILVAQGLNLLVLIREHQAYDWDAEQLQRQHPHLSLAEIHAALGYYYEHQSECDLLLDQEAQRLRDLQQQLIDPALQERLRAARTPA